MTIVESAMTLPGLSRYAVLVGGFYLTAVMGAYASQFTASGNWDFVWGKGQTPLSWTTIAVVVVFLAAVTYRTFWLPNASGSQSDHKIVLRQLGSIAFSIADDLTLTPGKRVAEERLKINEALQALFFAYKAVDGVCVTFYRYVPDPNGPARLEIDKTLGSRKPSGPFIAGTPRGDAAITFLSGDARAKFVQDMSQEDHNGWRGTGSNYQTYVSCPVSSVQGAYGMLTVDAPLVGDLNDDDGRVVELAAGLVAIALTRIH